MSIIDKVEGKVIQWIFGKSIKKAIARGVTLVVSWVLSLGLGQYGIDFDQEKLTLAIYMGLEMARNYIKIKFPKIGVYL